MAKEIKKSHYTNGSNIPFATDKGYYTNPNKAHFYANNHLYEEGELTYEEELFTLNAINDLCHNCGLDKKHNGGECRAKLVTCHICGIKGHYARVCKQDKTVSKTTPAQVRNISKQKRRGVCPKVKNFHLGTEV